jgi:TorA maturation chaperone TorD
MAAYDFETGTARENLCRFLAACHYQPGPEFAEEKVFDAMLDAATRIDPDLAMHARRLGEAFDAEAPECLLVDYTKLFLGPLEAVARPYGSVWLDVDRDLMQDSTMAVVALYAEGGFEISEDFRELPDHVAAELEFLYLLLFRENQAQRTADAEALATVAALRQRLLDEHLGSWVGPFTAAVKAGAGTPFYRELAELTNRFVDIEAKRSRAQ